MSIKTTIRDVDAVQIVDMKGRIVLGKRILFNLADVKISTVQNWDIWWEPSRACGQECQKFPDPSS